jgi:hypothetical protein
MTTYRISILIGKMDNSVCPPPFLAVLFPDASPSTVTLTEQECVVTFDTPQTPVDLGPLVRIELLP